MRQKLNILGDANSNQPVTTASDFNGIDAFAAVHAGMLSLGEAVSLMDTAEALVTDVTMVRDTATAASAISGGNLSNTDFTTGIAIALRSADQTAGQVDAFIQGMGESIEDGLLSADSLLQRAIDATKEYAAKVGEYLMDLLNKVVDYVTGLLGTSGDTASEYLDKLKDIKKAGKTNLDYDNDDMPENIQERFAKTYPCLFVKSGDIDADAYVAFIKTLDESVSEKDSDIVSATIATSGTVDTALGAIYQNADASANSIKAKVNELIKNALAIDFIKDAQGYKAGHTEGSGYGDIKEFLDTTDIDDMLDSDTHYLRTTVVGRNKDSVFINAYTFSVKANEAIARLKAGKKENGEDYAKASDVKKELTTIKNGIKFKLVSIKFDESTAIANMSNARLLEFSELEMIANKLKGVNKDISSKAKKHENTLKTITKKVKDSIDKIDKTISKASPSKDANKSLAIPFAESYLVLLEITSKHSLGEITGTVQGMTQTATGAVRFPLKVVMDESLRKMNKK